MSDPRPTPTMIGLVSTGRAHLAFPDKALYCNASRSVTGPLKRIGTDAGQDETVAALLGLGVTPALVCRRCLPLSQFHARYEHAWATQAEPKPDRAALIAVGQGVATGTEGEAPCFDCQRAYNADRPIVLLRAADQPDTDADTDTVHPHCWNLRVHDWKPDGATAEQPATLGGEVDRLVTRCAELTDQAQQARAAANTAEAVRDAQAASLAQLAEMAEQLRCLHADWHNDILTFREEAMRRNKPGLRYTTGRLTELSDRLSAAARGYAQPKPSDLFYRDLPQLLSEHGWQEDPQARLEPHEDTRPAPMLREEDRTPAWLRVWRRDGDHFAAWFTSPYSLDWVSCNTRGRLAELREIDRVITSKKPSRREPSGPGKPVPTDPAPDFTIDQADAILRRHGWTSSNTCDERSMTWRFEWTKRGHGLDEHGRPRTVHVYGYGQPGMPATVWYWAGRITVVPQLARIAER